MANWFRVSHQAAQSLINMISAAGGLPYTYARIKTDRIGVCLPTGAKLSHDGESWVIYGYHYAGADTEPFEKYALPCA